MASGLEFGDLIWGVCVQREAWVQEESAGGIAWLRFAEAPDAVLLYPRGTVAC
jgi:hypothetical protein